MLFFLGVSRVSITFIEYFLFIAVQTKKVPLLLFFFFVFVALRPMSTAMVIAGRSVHLTTLFPGQA